jgi:hypothetical protein
MVFVLNGFFSESPFPMSLLPDVLLPPAGAKLLPSGGLLLKYALGLFKAFMIACSAIVLGRMVLSRFSIPWASSLEALVVSTGLGYALLSYLTAALGAAGLLYVNLLRGLIVALFALSIFWFRRPSERDVFRGARNEAGDVLFGGGLRFLFAVLLIFILTVAFSMAFVPELFYDAIYYHLGVPNYYLHEHRIAPLDLMPSKFPLTIQMIHLLGLALQDEIVTKLGHLGMELTLILAMFSLGLRYKKPRLGLIAAVAFCATPTVQMNSWTSGVDLGVTLFGFLAFLSMLNSYSEEGVSRPWFILSALFSGLAFASKYTAFYIPALVFTLHAASLLRRRVPLKDAALLIVIFGAVAGTIASPWMIKNAIEVGNPFYPFLTKLFGGVSMDPDRYRHLMYENGGVALESVKDFFLAYWKIAVKERSSLSFQGPMFLGLIPLVFLIPLWNRAPWVKRLALYVALFAIGGLFVTRLTRYLLPGIATAAILIGLAIDSLLEDSMPIRRWGTLILFLTSYYYQASWACMMMNGSYTPRPVLVGEESRLDFIARYHQGLNPNPPVRMYEKLKTLLGPNDKVLIVGDEKAYPIAVRHAYSGVYDNGPLVYAANESRTAEEMAAKLQEKGITHLLLNIAEARRLAGYGIFRWTEAGFGVFSAFWEQHVQFQDVEYAAVTPDSKIPLLLLRVSIEPLRQAPVQNVLGPIFEENEFERRGIKTTADKLAFFEARLKEWPKVIYFNMKVQEYRALAASESRS